MPKPHPLADLIPSSNSFDLRAFQNSGCGKSFLLESAYKNGFVGCFDGHEGESWAKRIGEYDRDQFLHDTDGPHKFSEIVDSLPDSLGNDFNDPELEGCHVYSRHAFEQFA
ncbi:MAG: hypothetical protein MJA29_08705, partial [Candidatus Omnitrophica bacterium]|nr:hypothetical protein [Candidatus Omnitrophota bacterium]